MSRWIVVIFSDSLGTAITFSSVTRNYWNVVGYVFGSHGSGCDWESQRMSFRQILAKELCWLFTVNQYWSNHEIFTELDDELNRQKQNEHAIESKHIARKPGQGVRLDREGRGRNLRRCLQSLYLLVYLFWNEWFLRFSIYWVLFCSMF